MKRSEIIKEIYLLLEAFNMDNTYDEKGPEWCAELILDVIEESGMLPPYSNKMFQISMKNWSNESGHQWEPEDEVRQASEPEVSE